MKQKASTNYGEDYNRESMYETAREVLLAGKNVEMNGKNHSRLIDVMIEDAMLEEEKYKNFQARADEYDKINGKEFEALENLHYAINHLEKLIEIKERAQTSMKKCNEDYNQLSALIDSIKYEISVIDDNVLSLEELIRCYNVMKQVEKIYYNEMFSDSINDKTVEMYACASGICIGLRGKINNAKNQKLEA